MKLTLEKLTTSSNKLDDILVDRRRDQGRGGLGFVDKETSFKEVGQRSRLVLVKPFKKNVLPHKVQVSG
ncbi:hypothetical protein PVK06_018284 [Gossypium arboreum]|uniref:Uncharacterized protein n=1 Tax=Gossypium arboreum TaxID=29729 RepID=A0ABR0Q5E1_GOSAR|nr:hypothetical protein PVK06_018284 [Gossypium arboreum]